MHVDSLPIISDAEYQVMKVIWADAPISTNDVVEKLEAITSWKPKTIQTLLSRLVKKGVLRYEKNSRVFVYTPAVEESEYLARESENLLDRFSDSALNSMIVKYVEQNKLSRDDLQKLKIILDEKLS
jgi:BlaI family penicillinase repressor